MNKFLTCGLLASVAITATNVSSKDCSNGGFYVGVNAGLAFNKTKTSTKGNRYFVGDRYGGSSTDNVDDSSGAGTKTLVDEEVTEISESIAKTHKISKRKTGFLAEVVLGYDHRFNDVMMGVDLTFGTTFGKTSLKSKKPSGKLVTLDANKTNPSRVFAKIKRQWHIAFMPRIGYLFAPQFEGFVTAGVKLQKMKYETYKHGDVYLNGTVNTTTRNDFTNTEQLNAYNEKVKKTKTQMIPVVGVGIRYEIMPQLYTKLEYNYEFSKRVKLPKDGIVEVNRVNVATHVVKLGLGYKF